MTTAQEQPCEFSSLQGRTINEVLFDYLEGFKATFYCSNGDIFILRPIALDNMNVRFNGIVGDMLNLLHSPILKAEWVRSTGEFDDFSSSSRLDRDCDYWVYLDYKLSTDKGSVTFEWYGEATCEISELSEPYKLTMIPKPKNTGLAQHRKG